MTSRQLRGKEGDSVIPGFKERLHAMTFPHKAEARATSAFYLLHSLPPFPSPGQGKGDGKENQHGTPAGIVPPLPHR